MYKRHNSWLVALVKNKPNIIYRHNGQKTPWSLIPVQCPLPVPNATRNAHKYLPWNSSSPYTGIVQSLMMMRITINSLRDKHNTWLHAWMVVLTLGGNIPYLPYIKYWYQGHNDLHVHLVNNMNVSWTFQIICIRKVFS